MDVIEHHRLPAALGEELGELGPGDRLVEEERHVGRVAIRRRARTARGVEGMRLDRAGEQLRDRVLAPRRQPANLFDESGRPRPPLQVRQVRGAAALDVAELEVQAVAVGEPREEFLHRVAAIPWMEQEVEEAGVVLAVVAEELLAADRKRTRLNSSD